MWELLVFTKEVISLWEAFFVFAENWRAYSKPSSGLTVSFSDGCSALTTDCDSVPTSMFPEIWVFTPLRPSFPQQIKSSATLVTSRSQEGTNVFPLVICLAIRSDE